MLELQDLKDFSIHSWYHKFQDICIKSLLLEIPLDLRLRLQSDDSVIDIEEVCSPDYINQLKYAIAALGRCAFVKNNWHAPTDAKMFSFGNELKVTCLNDLILYLSVSNIISEDFSTIVEMPFYIVLRPWKSIHPASEFRCIVINNILRGITPRDWPTFYAHFKTEGAQIISMLREFFEDHIRLKFSRKHYVFDVILSYPEEPYIIDFAPLNSKTNLYAFSWKEIAPILRQDNSDDIAPIFRYLDSDIGIMTKADAIYKIANSLT